MPKVQLNCLGLGRCWLISPIPLLGEEYFIKEDLAYCLFPPAPALGLTQLATQLPNLTPQQAQTLLASMRSLSSAQHIQGVAHPQPQVHVLHYHTQTVLV